MQANRIDSRARGNAPQLLDKYKKLAHEASLNDDRVQTEYYLQFADHYFRVIADAKAQKEEAQAKRAAERGQNQSDDDDDDDDDRNDRNDRQNDRKARGRKNQRSRRDDNDPEQGSEGDEGDQSDDENPFTRDAADDDAKPKRKPRQPRKKAVDDNVVDNDGGLDPDMLPPSIARASEDNDADEKPKARRGLKPRRKPKDDGEEALEAVG